MKMKTMTIMMVVEIRTMAPDWGSVLSRVFIAEFSPRTLIQNFDAEAGWQMLRDRGTGGPRKVRVFSERKDPQHTLFCRET